MMEYVIFCIIVACLLVAVIVAILLGIKHAKNAPPCVTWRSQYTDDELGPFVMVVDESASRFNEIVKLLSIRGYFIHGEVTTNRIEFDGYMYPKLSATFVPAETVSNSPADDTCEKETLND